MTKKKTRRVVQDMRDWISWLEEEGQLARVTEPVEWDKEMGTIARRAYDVYGDASPAMLFQNIRDYPAPGPSPLMHVTAVTHRKNPIFQGSLEGHPINESHVMASVSKTATAWEALENAGITGIRDVATLPESATAHIVVSCKMSVAGQPDWISSVLWGQSNATWHWKHVIVVDEDIDPWDPQMVTWAMAWRVKASEDIKIWPRHRGSPLDPRAAPEEKGYWDRVLIDATKPFTWKPRDIWGSAGVNKGVAQNYPPTTIPDIEQIKQVNARWDELGIEPTKHYIGTPQGMMRVWWESPDTAASGGAGEAMGDQSGM